MLVFRMERQAKHQWDGLMLRRPWGLRPQRLTSRLPVRCHPSAMASVISSRSYRKCWRPPRKKVVESGLVPRGVIRSHGCPCFVILNEEKDPPKLRVFMGGFFGFASE